MNNPIIIDKLLANGLRVIIAPNHKAPVVNVTLGYKVGSKDDSFAHKGFAHFFEHLMFDGSMHVARGEFDKYCSKAGGQFNAYTSYDQTIYHTNLPAHQLELALWLESDRMMQFGVQQIGLETQQKVVIEEIKQVVENQPYGKWRNVQAHNAFVEECSYHWEVLGLREHIESATLDDVASFFAMYYRPDNACLVIAGAVEPDIAFSLVEKYFGDISRGVSNIARHAFSPTFRKTETTFMQDAVPLPAVFASYHCEGFLHENALCADILSSAASDGKSSPLYSSLVREQQIASSVHCYADQREHTSLLTFAATAAHAGISKEQLHDALKKEIYALAHYPLKDQEIEKARNVAATGMAQHTQTNAGLADLLCNQTLFWNDPLRSFTILDSIKKVDKEKLFELSSTVLREENCVGVIVDKA